MEAHTSESQFVEALVTGVKQTLGQTLGKDIKIDTGISLLYAITFDDRGNLRVPLDDEKRPKRGGGAGFQQDILVFEEAPLSAEAPGAIRTSIVPRVIAEVKLGGVTTHAVITYSEKARRIRAIYPFARYGLILGGVSKVPGRVLRLGQEFDFIVVLNNPPEESEIGALSDLLQEECQTSKDVARMLSGESNVTTLHRCLNTATPPSSSVPSHRTSTQLPSARKPLSSIR